LTIKGSPPEQTNNVCRPTFVPMEQNDQVRIPVAQNATEERIMGRYLLLWLLGIPLPILLLIWVIGGLH
jgi:hypothetical protein